MCFKFTYKKVEQKWTRLHPCLINSFTTVEGSDRLLPIMTLVVALEYIFCKIPVSDSFFHRRLRFTESNASGKSKKHT